MPRRNLRVVLCAVAVLSAVALASWLLARYTGGRRTIRVEDDYRQEFAELVERQCRAADELRARVKAAKEAGDDRAADALQAELTHLVDVVHHEEITAFLRRHGRAEPDSD